MKTYIITNEVSAIDFSAVGETSSDTLRLSLDGTKAVVKFDGQTPSFLLGKTQYTQAQILEELGGSEWVAPVLDPTPE